MVQLTDESGKVIKTYEYDSFGNEVKSDSKDENPFHYCGEYYDKETQEVYLRARYYQPAVGRFLTRDSYTGESDEPLSLHLYTYCENARVNMVDPTGHWGKTTYGAFVHQDITKTALNQYADEHYMDRFNPIICNLNSDKYNIILDSSILPDFITDKAKSTSKAKNKYGGAYYNKYKKYTRKFLWEIYKGR